jgi:hypothetical protein
MVMTQGVKANEFSEKLVQNAWRRLPAFRSASHFAPSNGPEIDR